MSKLDQKYKKLLNQPLQPPNDAWENIEKGLDQSKQNRKGVFWIWLTSSAASVLLIGGLFSIFLKKDETQPVRIVNHLPNIENKNPLNKDFLKSNELTYEHLNNLKAEKNSIARNNIHTHSANNNQIYTNINGVNFNSSTELEKTTLNLGSNHSKIILPHSTKTDLRVETYTNDSKTLSDHKKQDSIEALLAKNDVFDETSLEDIIKKEEDKNTIIELKIEQPKLLLSSYFSPIKMLDQQSILSNSFNTHPIDNALTYAYGAKVSYQLNDNLRIRGGIGKLDLNQRTNDVTTTSVIAASSDIQPLSNAVDNDQHIKYRTNNIILANAESFPTVFYSTENNRLSYQLQFVEFPLEMEYSLLKSKKFNLSAIAGGSIYLLTKNEIFLTNSNQLKQQIGEATNVNNSSFSTNAAVKLEYQLNQRILFQLEPNYKLLLNQVKDVEQNNYSLFGVNIGVAFKIK